MKTIITQRSSSIQIPVLLGAQTLFNVGFYTVVPFLAIVMQQDFGLATLAIGVILGVRTFAQQGMFLVGGTLADRHSPRSIVLLGIAVRVAGFALLSLALTGNRAELTLFVIGTILTGLGGALFSPALNVLIASAETARDARRVSLFAWLTVTGEIGAVVGPLVGAMLIGYGFEIVAGWGAVYFATIGCLLALVLPRPSSRTARGDHRVRGTRGHALTNGRFVAFAAVNAVDLLAYNQLYLAVPLALADTPNPTRTIGVVFAWVSLLTLAAQLPIARLSMRMGPANALRMGYALAAVGFTLIAFSLTLEPSTRSPAVFGAATALMVGHLLASPTALGLVSCFAGNEGRGSYFGLLATLGGCAVLLGNTAAGILGGLLNQPWAVWLVLGCLPACAAIAVARLAPAAAPTPEVAKT